MKNSGESTGSNLPLPVIHLLWVSAAALFLGIAVSLLTFRSPTPRKKAQLISRRSVAMPILFNAALVCLLADLFLTSGKGLQPSLAIVGGVLLVVFGLGFRFPRVVGIPVLFLFLLALGVTVWVFRDFHPFVSERAVLETRILNQGSASTLKEFDVRPEASSGNYPAGRFTRESSSPELLNEGLLVLHAPPASLFAGMDFYSLKTLSSLDILQQPAWQLLASAGWAQNLKPEAPQDLKTYYIYRLRTTWNRDWPDFRWQVYKPETELK